MKFLILASCVCVAVAAPPRFGQAAQATAQAAASTGARAAAYASGSDTEAQILVSESDTRVDGFAYKSETGNGISIEASGELKQIGDQAGVVIRGSYSYIGPDGTPVQVNYIADENGFQPQSDSIPVPPPVPEAIARSLEYIQAHPYQEVHKV